MQLLLIEALMFTHAFSHLFNPFTFRALALKDINLTTSSPEPNNAKMIKFIFMYLIPRSTLNPE